EARAVRMPAHGTDIAPLAPNAAPTVVRQQPPLRLGADCARERDELRRVSRLGGANADGHATTTPAPPRRGSPAAASEPSGSTSTAEAPPKKRLRRRHRTTSYPRASRLSSSAASNPPSQCTWGSSTCTR